MAHASRPRQSRRTGRTRGRRREAGRFGCRSFDPMPGYRAARGTARAVFARPAPRPGSRRSALCARVPRRHGRHGWCPPARSQDQDQARPGVPPPRPTRHRAARFVYPAAASRLRSDRPRAAGAGSVRPCRRSRPDRTQPLYSVIFRIRTPTVRRGGGAAGGRGDRPAIRVHRVAPATGTAAPATTLFPVYT